MQAFQHKELVARVKAILRRHVSAVATIPDPETETPGNELIIDRNRYQASVNGNPVNLTLTEFELLSFLASKKGWVFTRSQIVGRHPW